MLNGIPKISVVIITYNQEDVISRAIDSLLCQKDYIYEVCISDDCSQDGTWDVLQKYSRDYPELFRLNRNNPNLGIFKNIERTWSMPTGDIIYYLSGDDECGRGWFKKVVGFVQNNQIDYENESFCVYGDFKLCYPNGDGFVFRNDLCTNSKKLVIYSLIGVIENRSSCFSKRILEKFQAVAIGRSYIAETAQDIQMPFFTQKSYYIPYVGNIYYAGEGVSVHFDKDILKERMGIVPYALDFLLNNGYALSYKERGFVKYDLYLKRFQSQKRSPLLFILIIFWFLIVYMFPFKLLYKGIKRKWFPIRRSMAHKKSINMVI